MSVKNYEPQNYKFSDIKYAVRERRKTKIETKGISLIGIKSEKLKNEIQLAMQLVDDMEIKHHNWIEEKIKKIIPYFRGNKTKYSKFTESEIIEDIKNSFMEGLSQTIRQDNKHYGDISEINIGLENIIFGYFFDFYRTLKVCQNMEVNPSVALEIAKKSYYHNPDILIKLNKKYGEKVAPSLIQQAVVKSPQNSEAEIEKSVQKLEELRNNPKYSDLSQSLIDVAVFQYKGNPEAFLDNFIYKVEELSRVFPDLTQTVIKKIVTSNPKNAHDVIERFKNKVLELRNNPKYSILSQSKIEVAALRTPNNPEGFLDRYIEKISELKLNPKYSELNGNVLEVAAFNNTLNPESFLDNFIKKVAELKANPKYSVVKEYIIEKIALSKPNNPEDSLDNFLIKVAELKANPNYSNLNSYFIETAAFGKPSNTELYLDRFINKVKELKANPKYSFLQSYIIETIAFDYPSKPEITLDRFIIKVNEIRTNPHFSSLSISIIERTILKNINNPEDALNKILKNKNN